MQRSCNNINSPYVEYIEWHETCKCRLDANVGNKKQR